MIFLHLFLTIGIALHNLQTIENILNDFFHFAAPAIQSKIKFPCKSFNDYLPSKNYDSSTITTSKTEIDAIIFSLSSKKLTGPNSIAYSF